MYNKEGVARCHADRQTTERLRARGERRQTSTVNFICFFHNRVPACLLISDVFRDCSRSLRKSALSVNYQFSFDIQLCNHSAMLSRVSFSIYLNHSYFISIGMLYLTVP